MSAVLEETRPLSAAVETPFPAAWARVGPQARPIRVLLVDDDPMVVRGLRLMLEAGSEGQIDVVGVAGDGTQVVPAVQAHHPDVVLMDVRMPRRDGISATRDVVALPHAPAVVVLTTFDGADEPIRAAHAGAAGSCSRRSPPRTSSRPSGRWPPGRVPCPGGPPASCCTTSPTLRVPPTNGARAGSCAR